MDRSSSGDVTLKEFNPNSCESLGIERERSLFEF